MSETSFDSWLEYTVLFLFFEPSKETKFLRKINKVREIESENAVFNKGRETTFRVRVIGWSFEKQKVPEIVILP